MTTQTDQPVRDPAALPLTGLDAPVELQQGFWDQWNTMFLEHARARPSQRQAELVLEWFKRFGRRDLEILDVGCGSGWMSAQLAEFGSVCGVDLSAGVLELAQRKFPKVRFIAGDFMTLDLPADAVDVVVSLEVLAHVADHAAFLRRVAERLKPGGTLMLSTQNRFVFQRLDGIAPLAPGLIRRWVSVRQLRQLLERDFVIDELMTVVPQGHRGILRIVNSTKLNGMAAILIGQGRLDRWKERLGLGQTSMALARKRAGTPAPVGTS